MILDGHIHITDDSCNPEQLLAKLREANIDGGVLISLPPSAFSEVARPASSAARLRHVLSWCEGRRTLYPFYWIDPLEPDAADQVAAAVEQGIMGFKVICDRYLPGDDRAMSVFHAIAAAARPILFHAGILWDGKPSSCYNRPVGFESLLLVRGLRFSLAHLAWPWCDELLAVYGKFQNAWTRTPDLSVEMFIDTTPGTPPLYRRDVLTRLFTIGYDVADNVIFGSDGSASRYHVEWARQWLETDAGIFSELGLSKDVLEGVYSANLRRFLGLGPAKTERKPLMPGTN
jgi:predicted TIM-barrel fold metal-dependent hydrolase